MVFREPPLELFSLEREGRPELPDGLFAAEHSAISSQQLAQAKAHKKITARLDREEIGCFPVQMIAIYRVHAALRL
jgi:hypothetical protein